MNLLRLAEQLAMEDSRTITLSGAQCVRYRDKMHRCRACGDICPVGAIEVGALPTLDTERCQRCLACLPACPTGAITGEDEVPSLLNCAAAVQARRLELLCQLNPDTDSGVPGVDAAVRVRGCLAGLGSATLILLAATGLDLIVVRTDACAVCPWKQASDEVIAQVGEARAMLAFWEYDTRLQLSGPAQDGWKTRPVYLADSPPVSRRDLFRVRHTESGQEAGPASGHHPFRERLRLVRALRLLGPPLAELAAAPLPLRGFAVLGTAGNCTACGACARICPTGAVALGVDDEVYRLTFSSQACIACEMCVHVCGPGALTANTAPTYAAIFDGPGVSTLQEGAVARCQRCRAPFPAATGSRYCAVCEYRRQNPFGTAVPPALAAMPVVATLRQELS